MELDEETLERRRGRERKGRPVGRYLMCVHVTPELTQIAVLEGRSLIEHYVSRPADDVSQIHGNIYLGRVQNVLPGMEAAFVDIGTPKNAVLYRGDVQYDAEDIVEKGRAAPHRADAEGQQIIVCQVTKNPIGAKGARLTQEVSLPGPLRGADPELADLRHLQAPARRRAQAPAVDPRQGEAGRARPHRAHRGRERDRGGAASRRAAAAAPVGGQSRRAAKQAPARPALLYREPDMAVRVIREEFNRSTAGVVIDDRRLFDEVQRLRRRRSSPALADRVEYYDAEAEGLPLFERFHIHEQLHKALDRKVWLPSGGSLIIEHTEALTVIDVNTGKNVGTSNLEETVFHNNLEAAEEIARQLRLRDIGGIIVIDFIDMEIRENRQKVVAALPGRAGPGQDPHAGVRHLRARPGGDDPQAHRRGPAHQLRRPAARSARAAGVVVDHATASSDRAARGCVAGESAPSG